MSSLESSKVTSLILNHMFSIYFKKDEYKWDGAPIYIQAES
jgi:hypothetical protein